MASKSFSQKPSPSQARCPDCQHYYITWEPAHPYGCRAFGFKGKRMPWTVVLESSGAPCTLFRLRSQGPGAAKGEGQGVS